MNWPVSIKKIENKYQNQFRGNINKTTKNT